MKEDEGKKTRKHRASLSATVSQLLQWIPGEMQALGSRPSKIRLESGVW